MQYSIRPHALTSREGLRRMSQQYSGLFETKQNVFGDTDINHEISTILKICGNVLDLSIAAI